MFLSSNFLNVIIHGIVNYCRLENPYVDDPGCIMVNSIKVKECLMYCESSEYMCSLCIILSIRQFEKAVFRILIYRLISFWT